MTWFLQTGKEEGNAQASEDNMKAEDGVKGEGDNKGRETESADGEAMLDSEPKQNGSTEVDKLDQDGKEEGKKDTGDKEAGKSEVKQEEGKKEDTKKEPKEQLPEKATLQLHGKHSSSGKLLASTDIKFRLWFCQICCPSGFAQTQGCYVSVYIGDQER